MKRLFTFLCIIALMVASLPIKFTVFAMDGGTEAIGSVMLPTIKEEIISVDLPTVGDESPFDFYIDTEELIYGTDAAKYGGGSVEEDATLLFRNHEGDYDFSRYSDQLTVRNQSNIPVIVTIAASVDDLGEIEMVGSPDFDEDESCSMYLALVDDEGNEKAVFEKGEASVSIEMRKAPDNAYVYRIDEETGSYSYELVSSADEIDFDTYSFGLKGYCNPNGDWQDISVHPYVRVTWRVEPVLSEDVVDEEDKESVEDIDADTDTDIDTTDTETAEDTDIITDEMQTDSSDKYVSEDIEDKGKDEPKDADGTASVETTETDEENVEPTSKEEESPDDDNISTVSVNAVDVTGENTDE